MSFTRRVFVGQKIYIRFAGGTMEVLDDDGRLLAVGDDGTRPTAA